MRNLTVILAILMSAFAFSCGDSETDKEKLKEELKEELRKEMDEKDDDEKTVPKETELQTTIVNQRKVVDINSLKVGDEVFGLTVKDLNIKAYNNFSISFAGEFILEGKASLSEYDFSLTFSPNEPTNSNAVIKSGDIEKPFFMLWNLRNSEKFKSALGNERLEKIEKEQEIRLRIKFENYQIGAEEFYIGGSVDFLEILD